MKPTTYLAAIAAFSFTATAYADVTVNITGATAFRAATLLAIRSRFNDSGVAYKFAHDQATAGGTIYSGATRAIFIGTFPGVSGTTTIRCCFNGSVEGIRSLVGASDPVPPTYYQSSLLDSTTAIIGGAELHNQGTTGATTPSPTGDIAFSDVSKAITPYASSNLQPASPPCGVVVFTMLTNEGSSVSNVTAQQFRALLSSGFQPLSMFTGNAGDTTNVFVTGRNDGSGTRSSYLAETGFGASNPVKQYLTVASTSGALKAIQLVPVGGVNDSDSGTAGVQLPPGSDILAYHTSVAPFAGTGATITQLTANASTVWGQDVAGNGGYSSGSTLRTDMGKTGTSGVTVFDETGTDSFGGTVRADLVTWLSLNDAVTARGNGAILCGYNGVKLNDIATSGSTMSATDKAKVTEGLYTAWNFQQMYCRNGIYSGDVKTVYDGIKAEIPTNLGAAGITLTDMHVGRPNDGGTVAP
jgi:hypothetical protein